MDHYQHIRQMEQILNQQNSLMQEISTMLDRITESEVQYQALIAYYYSDQYRQDLQDDENGKIPADLNRGVLSEDGIWELIGDRQETGVRMIETALGLIDHRK